MKLWKLSNMKKYNVFINGQAFGQVSTETEDEAQHRTEALTYFEEKGAYTPGLDMLELVPEGKPNPVIKITDWRFKKPRYVPLTRPEEAIKRAFNNLIGTYGDVAVMDLVIAEFKLKRSEDEGAA